MLKIIINMQVCFSHEERRNRISNSRFTYGRHDRSTGNAYPPRQLIPPIVCLGACVRPILYFVLFIGDMRSIFFFFINFTFPYDLFEELIFRWQFRLILNPYLLFVKWRRFTLRNLSMYQVDFRQTALRYLISFLTGIIYRQERGSLKRLVNKQGFVRCVSYSVNFTLEQPH
jgi:hypothetical protein